MIRRCALAEMALFAAASAAGVWGLGEALHGDVWWLAVTGVSLLVLSRQMGRIQDRAPRRRAAGDSPVTTAARRAFDRAGRTEGPRAPAPSMHHTTSKRVQEERP